MFASFVCVVQLNKSRGQFFFLSIGASIKCLLLLSVTSINPFQTVLWCGMFAIPTAPTARPTTIDHRLKESVKPLIDKWNTINVSNPFITCNSERLIQISVSIDGFYSRPNTTMVNGVHIKKKSAKQNKTNDERHSTIDTRKCESDVLIQFSLSLFLCFYFGCKQCNVVRPSCMVRKATPAQTTIFRISKTDLSIAVFACYRNIFLHLIHFVRMQFIDLARVWSLARSNMQNVNLDVVFDLFVWNCGNRQDR